MKRTLLFLFATICIVAAPFLNAEAQESSGTIRILAIGNSFSQDAIEQYLWELGDAAGETFIIGNMYIGGCTLERHARNCRENRADYEYRKVADGVRTNTPGYTLEKALADEQWDIISVQQASGSSGCYDTFHPFIDELLEFVKARMPEGCRIIFHQTWAYQGDSSHDEFPKYGSDQMKMYKSIVKAERQAMKDCGIQTVVPSGTAVQNMRTSFVGDHMTRDGYHMDLYYGRYTLACTWFEVITGKSVVGNPYHPEAVTDSQAEVAQISAHNAVKRAWKVTRAPKHLRQ